jgi:hypothetical protein
MISGVRTRNLKVARRRKFFGGHTSSLYPAKIFVNEPMSMGCAEVYANALWPCLWNSVELSGTCQKSRSKK